MKLLDYDAGAVDTVLWVVALTAVSVAVGVLISWLWRAPSHVAEEEYLPVLLPHAGSDLGAMVDRLADYATRI